MAEVWPSKLRASGMGLAYGFGNLGKFIGPAGLAVIAGSDNFVTPKATLAALVPAMNYFGFWYLVGAAAIWFIGIRDQRPHHRGNRQHVERAGRRWRLDQGLRGNAQCASACTRNGRLSSIR